MIAKILPSKSFSKVLDYHYEKLGVIPQSGSNVLTYHYNKLEKLNAEMLLPEQKSFTQKEALNFLNETTYLKKSNSRKLTKEPILHVTLSFNQDEKIDNETMTRIAQDYMNMLGFRNNNAILVRHNDTLHPHVHIILNRIDNETLKVTYKKMEKLNSIRIAERLEKKYNLKKTDFKIHKNSKDHYQGRIKSLRDKINIARNESHSLYSLRFNLLNKGIVLTHKINKQGKETCGYRYDYFKNTGFFNSFEIGKGYGYDKLKYKYKDDKQAIKSIVNGQLKMYNKFHSLGDYLYLLKQEGIEAELAKYKDGRIYGISYIYNGIKLKGSEIGVSWDSLKSHINSLDEVYRDTSKSHQDEIMDLFAKKTARRLPYLTKTEFNNLSPKNKKIYISTYFDTTGALTLEEALNGIKEFASYNLKSQKGILNDIEIGNIELSESRYDINMVKEKIDFNVKGYLYNLCRSSNDFFEIKSNLSSKFGDNFTKDENFVVNIGGTDYDLRQFGFHVPSFSRTDNQTQDEAIFGTDHNRWDFDDELEKLKRKRKKGGPGR